MFQFLTFGEEVGTIVQPKIEKEQQFCLQDSRSWRRDTCWESRGRRAGRQAGQPSSRCSALQQDTNRNPRHRESGSLGNAMHAVPKIGPTYVATGPRLPVATLVSQKYQSEELAILQQCTKLISEVSISGITLPSAIHRRRSQFDHSLVTLTIVRGSQYWPRQARCLIS